MLGREDNHLAGGLQPLPQQEKLARRKVQTSWQVASETLVFFLTLAPYYRPSLIVN